MGGKGRRGGGSYIACFEISGLINDRLRVYVYAIVTTPYQICTLF